MQGVLAMSFDVAPSTDYPFKLISGWNKFKCQFIHTQ